MRLLIFVALMLALLKYNQQVMSAVNAPAELIGFPVLPGFDELRVRRHPADWHWR